MSERKRLEAKQKGLQSEWDLRHEQLVQLREELVIETDVAKKFEIEKRM
jgi:hypothetical protein